MMFLSQNDEICILTMRDKGLFNPNTLEQFNSVLDEIEKSESAKALLITGEDKNFSQGLDLEFLMTIENSDFLQFVENTMVMASRLLTFKVPVVSVINGHAFGLGAMIALASDYRVMREDRGYLCLPEVDLKMAFTPAMNALVVNKLSGRLRRDMMLAGRRVGGGEALAGGLMDACGAEDELLNLARELVTPAMGKDKATFSQIKRDLNRPIFSVVESGSGVRQS